MRSSSEELGGGGGGLRRGREGEGESPSRYRTTKRREKETDKPKPIPHWDPNTPDNIQQAFERMKLTGGSVFPGPDPAFDDRYIALQERLRLRQRQQQQPPVPTEIWKQRRNVDDTTNVNLGKVDEFFARIARSEWPLPGGFPPTKRVTTSWASRRPPPMLTTEPPIGPEMYQRDIEAAAAASLVAGRRSRDVVANCGLFFIDNMESPMDLTWTVAAGDINNPPKVIPQFIEAGGGTRNNCLYNSMALAMRSICNSYGQTTANDPFCKKDVVFKGANLRDDLLNILRTPTTFNAMKQNHPDTLKLLADEAYTDLHVTEAFREWRDKTMPGMTDEVLKQTVANDGNQLAAWYVDTMGDSGTASVITHIYPGMMFAIFARRTRIENIEYFTINTNDPTYGVDSGGRIAQFMSEVKGRISLFKPDEPEFLSRVKQTAGALLYRVTLYTRYPTEQDRDNLTPAQKDAIKAESQKRISDDIVTARWVNIDPASEPFNMLLGGGIRRAIKTPSRDTEMAIYNNVKETMESLTLDDPDPDNPITDVDAHTAVFTAMFMQMANRNALNNMDALKKQISLTQFRLQDIVGPGTSILTGDSLTLDNFTNRVLANTQQRKAIAFLIYSDHHYRLLTLEDADTHKCAAYAVYGAADNRWDYMVNWFLKGCLTNPRAGWIGNNMGRPNIA